MCASGGRRHLEPEEETGLSPNDNLEVGAAAPEDALQFCMQVSHKLMVKLPPLTTGKTPIPTQHGMCHQRQSELSHAVGTWP